MFSNREEIVQGERADFVAHCVVHGGARFFAPTLIDEAAGRGIEELDDLAPLHNASALAAIRGARESRGREAPL